MGKKGNTTTRGISRRSFLKAGGLAGAAILGGGALSACGGGGEGGGGGSGSELVFYTNPDDTGTMAQLVERFNERGGTRVTMREGNADTGQRFDQLRTQFQAGQTDIDVILGDVIWSAQLAANGWISTLSDLFENQDEYLPGSIEAVTFDGEIYGVPWFTDTGLLYYRADLLEESGFSEPPTTWDELMEMAEVASRDANLDNGFVFQGANYEGGVCNGLEFIWGHGGNALDPDDATRVVVDSPEAVAGLTTERSMVESGVSPQSIATYREDESAGAFLNGNAVFLRNWPYVYALVGAEGESVIETGQVGVSELPSAEGGPGFGTVGDQPLYITATSEKQEAAWEFIQFLAEAEQQKLRAIDGSFLPTLTALYEDEEIRESVPVVPLAQEALQNTRPRPVSPYYSDLSLEMAELFNDSLNGDIPPEEAAASLQSAMERIIEQGENA